MTASSPCSPMTPSSHTSLTRRTRAAHWRPLGCAISSTVPTRIYSWLRTRWRSSPHSGPDLLKLPTSCRQSRPSPLHDATLSSGEWPPTARPTMRTASASSEQTRLRVPRHCSVAVSTSNSEAVPRARAVCIELYLELRTTQIIEERQSSDRARRVWRHTESQTRDSRYSRTTKVTTQGQAQR